MEVKKWEKETALDVSVQGLRKRVGPKTRTYVKSVATMRVTTIRLNKQYK